MSNLYSENEDYQQRGIDYDLEACLEYNPQSDFTVTDIEKVLAVWEGHNDEDDWRWILQLKNGDIYYLQGGCDYTGWDCRSWATSQRVDTPEAAAELVLGEVIKAVRDSLLTQLQDGKTQTWHERTRDSIDSEDGE